MRRSLCLFDFFTSVSPSQGRRSAVPPGSGARDFNLFTTAIQSAVWCGARLL